MVRPRKENARLCISMGNANGNPKEHEDPKEDGWMDGVRCITYHPLTQEDTRNNTPWRNFVVGEGKPL